MCFCHEDKNIYYSKRNSICYIVMIIVLLKVIKSIALKHQIYSLCKLCQWQWSYSSDETGLYNSAKLLSTGSALITFKCNEIGFKMSVVVNTVLGDTECSQVLLTSLGHRHGRKCLPEWGSQT